MAIIDKIALDYVIDSGAQATSSFLSNQFNKSMMDYEYELNEKAARNAYNRQLDFWNRQNAYDDPSSQVRRLQRAGLNPGILNGNSSNVSNNLSSVSSGGASTPGARPGKDVDVLPMLVAEEQLKNLKANTQLTNEKAEAERLSNMKQAVEANDWESYWSLTLTNLESQGKLNKASMMKYKAEAFKAFEDARQFKEFGDTGGNVYQDESNLTNQQIEDIKQRIAESQQNIAESKQRISESDARIQNLAVDNDIKSLSYELSKKFDEDFLKLDYDERKKAVEEFLDTSEVRVGLYNVQKSFAKLAVDEATRQDAIAKITHEYDKHVAEQILDAAKDGMTALDAVLLQYFVADPGSALSALSHIVAAGKPNIIHNHRKGTYVNL